MKKKAKFKKGQIVCIRGRIPPEGLAIVCRQSFESEKHFLVNANRREGERGISTFYFHQSEIRPLTKKESNQ